MLRALEIVYDMVAAMRAFTRILRRDLIVEG